MSDSGNRKVRIGTVISNKMDKTATVLVERRIRHPQYHRIVRVSKKFLAQDENNDCQIGDEVRIVETRPLSKRKRWRVVEVTERAK
jgi:small subunit ribosomal protein S17